MCAQSFTSVEWFSKRVYKSGVTERGEAENPIIVVFSKLFLRDRNENHHANTIQWAIKLDSNCYDNASAIYQLASVQLDE